MGTGNAISIPRNAEFVDDVAKYVTADAAPVSVIVKNLVWFAPVPSNVVPKSTAWLEPLILPVNPWTPALPPLIVVNTPAPAPNVY